MFAKLAAIIIALGIVGCTVLALRQQRLQAAHELAESQLRIRRSDEQLWLLRTQIAHRLNPEAIRDMATAVGPHRPIAAPTDLVEPLGTTEQPHHADSTPEKAPHGRSPSAPHDRLAHDPKASKPEHR